MERIQMQRHARFMAAVKILRRVMAYAVVICGALVMLIPFIYMVTTSLMTRIQSLQYPPQWIPNPVVWENYTVQIWQTIQLQLVLFNSFKISLLSVAGRLISCSMAGYAFACLRFRGRQVVFWLLLSMMMVPFQVTLIPQFLLYRQLGWINTHQPLWVGTFFGAPFATFLFRQFFMSLPEELADAARVDGANPFQIFLRVFLPLAQPAIGAITIFTFLGKWNNLLHPLVYLRDEKLMTFPVVLSFLRGYHETDVPLLMTASVVSIVPTLIVFLLNQRYFVRGVVLSGLKG